MDYEHLSPSLLNRLLLLQSFFDRVSMVAIECSENQPRLATRVLELAQQYEALLKGKGTT